MKTWKPTWTRQYCIMPSWYQKENSCSLLKYLMILLGDFTFATSLTTASYPMKCSLIEPSSYPYLTSLRRCFRKWHLKHLKFLSLVQTFTEAQFYRNCSSNNIYMQYSSMQTLHFRLRIKLIHTYLHKDFSSKIKWWVFIYSLSTLLSSLKNLLFFFFFSFFF